MGNAVKNLLATGFRKSKDVKGAYDRDIKLQGRTLTIRVDPEKVTTAESLPKFVESLLQDAYSTGSASREYEDCDC